MLNFGRGDAADPKTAAKPALKPALYDPPGTPKPAATANPQRPAGGSTWPTPNPAPAPAASPPVLTDPTPPSASPASGAEPPGSKLSVGVNIKLKGVDISDCDVLVIEGTVEATVNSKVMQIAKPGTLKGTAAIDVAEIHGDFSGELTARTRLVVHGTGRVSGTIRYGKLIVEEGGELSGDVKRLDAADEHATAPAAGTALGRGGGSMLSPH